MHNAKSIITVRQQIRRCVGLGSPTLLVAFCVGCASPLQAQSVTPLDQQTAPPDAVIELWEQHWTLKEDGSTVYHEKKHLRLNSDRVYRELADPRITYNVDTDELEILVARVRRADGSYKELPDYSHVMVSPNASQGWPAFASIRQHLLVMSGIEPGCVVELEYKITSKPRAWPYLAADVRLDHRYPVRQHTIAIDTPADVQLRTVLSGLPPGMSDPAPNQNRWRFTDLPGLADEPQSPPWRTSGARLAFSTVSKASDWLKHWTKHLDAAADESDMITELATEWTEDHQDPSDKLRALQEKLAGSFNFVEFPVAWRPGVIRPASELIQCSYGLPEESAALLLALARAVDLPVLPGILVNEEVWHHQVPQDGMVAAYVVLHIAGQPGEVRMVEAGQGSGAHFAVFDTGDYPEIWHPRRGRIVRDSHWAGYRLLPVPDMLMPRTLLPAWTDAAESRCNVQGKVTLNDDGTFAGELSLRITGLFVSPESLRSTAAQKSRVSSLLSRVLPEVKVESFSVTMLSPGEFEVVAQVKSSKVLEKVGGSYALRLAAEGPFLADVPLPLACSRRENPVRLNGAFDEQIDVTIQWPEEWAVEAQPSAVAQVGGDWGSIEQRVAPDEHSLRLQRYTRVAQRELPPESFLLLRKPLNELRSEHARTLLLKP